MTTVRGASLVAAILLVFAGVTAVLGSIGPWLTVRTGLGSISLSGTDGGGDGNISLILGALLVLAGVINLGMVRLPSLPESVLYALATALLLGVVVLDYQSIQDKITTVSTEYATGNVGWGFFLIGVAAIFCAASVICSWRGMALKRQVGFYQPLNVSHI